MANDVGVRGQVAMIPALVLAQVDAQGQSPLIAGRNVVDSLVHVARAGPGLEGVRQGQVKQREEMSAPFP